jgi:hypothetical protein
MANTQQKLQDLLDKVKNIKNKPENERFMHTEQVDKRINTFFNNISHAKIKPY